MATAQDIIERAYKLAKVTGLGESPTDEQISEGLVYLNDLIQSLSNESLMIYQNVQESITCDGSTSYTIGSGGDLDTVRPFEITGAFFRINGTTVDNPVEVITKDEYDSISFKTSTSDAIDYLYLYNTYPLAELFVYPLAQNGTLFITSRKPLTGFAARTTTVALPDGYEPMLRYNLAVELMPQYGTPANMAMFQLVVQNAKTLKANIKMVNSKTKIASIILPVSGVHNRSKIERGY